MQRPNLNGRSTIERIYPLAVFRQEANASARANASLVSGVRILSAADAAGAFDLVRASRHAGETDPSDGAIFLSPMAQEARPGSPRPTGKTPMRASSTRSSPSRRARNSRRPPARVTPACAGSGNSEKESGG